MYKITKNNEVKRYGGLIWNYIYNRDFFMKTINQIDDKIMNTKMVCHEDFLLFFLLTRNAKNIKNIKRIFYAHITLENTKKSSILYSHKEKELHLKNNLMNVYHI